MQVSIDPITSRYRNPRKNLAELRSHSHLPAEEEDTLEEFAWAFGKETVQELEQATHTIIEHLHQMPDIERLSDEGIKATGLLGILTARLDEAGVQYHVFTDCKPEPTYGQVEAVVDMVQGQECDLIIGLGGGSVMDAAKLASVLKGASYTIKDLMNDPTLAEKK